MLSVIGDVVKGVVTGMVGAALLGVVIATARTVIGWPENGGPEARTRHLAEAISGGMGAAMIVSLVMVPVMTVVFLRRSRR